MANRAGMYIKEVVDWARKRWKARRARNRSRRMWIRVVLSALKSLTVLLLVLIVYSVWFYYGEPAITTDYVELATKLDTPGEVIGQNAWPCYEKAGSLYIVPGGAMEEILYRSGLRSFPDANGQQQEIIRRWLKDNRPAWRQLEEASRRHYCIPQCNRRDRARGRYR